MAPDLAAVAGIPAALARVKQAALDLRAAAVELQQTIHQTHAPMLAAGALMKHAAAADVGAVMRLLQHEEHRHRETMTALVNVAGPDRVKLDAFVSGVQAGIIQAAMLCPCKACATCQARDAQTGDADQLAAVEAAVAAEYDQTGQTEHVPVVLDPTGMPARRGVTPAGQLQ